MEGYWWLPGNENEKLPGTLTFSPGEGWFLTLEGGFLNLVESLNNLYNRVLAHQIILGKTLSGDNVTLLNCVEKNIKIPIRVGEQTTPTIIYFAPICFIGKHFTKPEEINFAQISAKYNRLVEWCGYQGYQISHDPTTSRLYIQLKTHVSPIAQAKLSDDCHLELKPQTDFSLSNFPPEVHIIPDVYSTIGSKEPRSWELFLKLLRIFQDFLSFMCDIPIYPIRIWGVSEFDNQKIEIAYRLPSYSSLNNEKEMLPADMLCKFNQIKHKFSDVISKWFNIYHDLEPVYDLYLGYIYNPTIYKEQHFLSLVMALEVYHRRVIGNEEIPSAKHVERMEEIIKSVHEKYKEWLKNKLEYSNEPSLRQRLKDIFEKIIARIGYFDKLLPEKNTFIHKVVATRNYLVHFDESLKGQIFDFREELFWAIEKIKCILIACLLKELGFSNQEIDDVFSSNNRYSQLIERAKG